jgi:hypothetical protein
MRAAARRLGRDRNRDQSAQGRYDSHVPDAPIPHRRPLRSRERSLPHTGGPGRRLLPEDLIDIAVEHDLHFDQTIQQGVTFNLIGALSELGKLGVVSIADSVEHASALFERTVAVLDREAAELRAD